MVYSVTRRKKKANDVVYVYVLIVNYFFSLLYVNKKNIIDIHE